MKSSRFCRKFVLYAIIICTGIITVAAEDTASITECETRCQPLSGEARYKCIKTCLSSKRRSDSVSENKKKGSFQECEQACSSLTGLEGIQCIRTCMENRRTDTPVRKETDKEKPAAVAACESRCGILTGDLREKCLARCRKEKYGEYRDPLRFKK